MPVNSKHPDYEKAFSVWTLCDDFIAGTRAVKAKGEKYLPRPNPDDISRTALKRYENYKARAVFYEYSSKIVNQYLGLAFKQDPTVELAEVLQGLITNADGQGTSLYHLAQKGLKSLLVNGRFGVWVDYPKVQEPSKLSAGEQMANNIRPKLLFYPAKSIINWQDNLIVLQESVQKATNDPFVTETVNQWRVLGIDEVGYYVAVWQETDGTYVEIDRYYPTDGNSKHWQVIPFQIFGSQYNTWEIQQIPIEPLVHIEKGIYCNSADAENSRFLCGQVQPFMNTDSHTMNHYLEEDEHGNIKNPLRLGSETVIMLGETGSFGFAQAQSNTMATEGISEKRGIINELGFQLGQGDGIKTATQADNEAQAQHSQASLCTANLNEGFLTLLRWCNAYIGVTDEPKFIIRQQFNQQSVDVGVLTGLAQLVDGGKLPRTVIYDKAREFNLINAELTNDDIDGLLDG